MDEIFKGRLKELRKAASLTQAQFSEQLNVHLQTVSKWERGISEPDFSILGEIAKVLHISLERLVGVEEQGEVYTGTFDISAFGKNLSSLRKSKGESQETLAAITETSPDIVSKWERGVICPNVGQLLRLAEHFALPVSKLYFGISEGTRTETPVQARRRKRFSLVLAGVGALFCAAFICLVIFLPQPEQSEAETRTYTVTVDGIEYEVSSLDWFTPQEPEKAGYEFVCYVDGSGEAVNFPVKISQDMQFTAVFTPEEYNIDYWLNGGAFTADAVYSFTVESGVIELPVPRKQGASFEGWYLTPDFSGEAVERIECAASDVKLYAKWDNTVYSVRYELCGGTLAQSNPAQVTAEEEIALSEPIRKGYDFLGWYDAPSGGKRYESVGGKNAQNLTLYALWQESGRLYSVTYHTDGGKLLGDNPVSVGAGETHALFDAQKDGYDFVGWNTRQDGGGEWIDTLYGIRGDLALYAVYTPKTYTIIYNLDGGTYYEGTNPNKILFGETVKLVPVAKKGYTFVGWFDSENGGNEVKQIDESNILRLTVVYARFTLDQYEITLDGAGGLFDAGGGLTEKYTFVVSVKDEFTLPLPTLAGCDFVGWNTRQDGGGEWIDTLYGIRGDLALYAVYTPKTYTIIYNLDGGTYYEGTNPNKILFGETVKLVPVAKKGYTFVGWFDSENGGNEVKQIDESNILRLTVVYARFTLDQYEITLDGAGGLFDAGGGLTEKYTFVVSAKDEFTLPSPTLAGCDFVGWFDENGEQVESISIVNLADMLLTAKYRPAGMTYAVEYVLNGGTQSNKNPTEVAWGQVVFLADPTREGFKFLGWNDAADGSGAYYEATPAGWEKDLTLYAIWQEILISGSAENFTYAMGNTSVTITGYNGPFGENIDLVIPSYIDAKPVVAIEGKISPSSPGYGVEYFHSITLPDTMESLGDGVFATLCVEEPITIPASVKEIGAYCFRYSTFCLYFEDGSSMSELGEYSFSDALIENIVVLPNGLKMLGFGAFQDAYIGGIILPETLEYIARYSLAFCEKERYGRYNIYIPASVRFIDTYAFYGGSCDKMLFLGSDEYESSFSMFWDSGANVSYNFIEEAGVTLDYGDRTEYLEGHAFALPSPQKEGHTFLGWYDQENMQFANSLYILDREGVVLKAVYEEQTPSDGRSISTPALFALGQEYEFILPPEMPLYFKPDVGSSFLYIFMQWEVVDSFGGDGAMLYLFNWSMGVHIDAPEETSSLMEYSSGDILQIYVESGTNYHIRVKIKITAVA